MLSASTTFMRGGYLLYSLQIDPLATLKKLWDIWLNH